MIIYKFQVIIHELQVIIYCFYKLQVIFTSYKLFLQITSDNLPAEKLSHPSNPQMSDNQVRKKIVLWSML